MFDVTRRRLSEKVCGRVILSVAMAAIISGALTSNAFAQPAVRIEMSPAELGRYLWQGWTSEREKLETGRFAAEGKAVHLARTKSGVGEVEITPVQEQAIELDAVCNWKSQALKFHFAQWGPRGRGIWAQTDRALVQWPDLGKGVVATIHAPDESRLSWARLIDPRVAGVATSSDYGDHGLSFADAKKRISALPEPTSADELGEGRFSLVYESKQSATELGRRDTFVINKSRGFTIEVMQIANVTADRAIPVMNAKVDWTEKDDVWVPTSIDYYGRQSLFAIQLALRWRAVNTEVPAAEFEVKNLGIPPETIISDQRTDSPRLKTPLEKGA
jgi:hypothetical protein